MSRKPTWWATHAHYSNNVIVIYVKGKPANHLARNSAMAMLDKPDRKSLNQKILPMLVIYRD
jgi:hypothetical protein